MKPKKARKAARGAPGRTQEPSKAAPRGESIPQIPTTTGDQMPVLEEVLPQESIYALIEGVVTRRITLEDACSSIEEGREGMTGREADAWTQAKRSELSQILSVVRRMSEYVG